jgi:hypothetical protein
MFAAHQDEKVCTMKLRYPIDRTSDALGSPRKFVDARSNLAVQKADALLQ